MIQYAIIKHSPRFLRWYRTRFLLDWKALKTYVPERGKLLDVGCGVGSIDYEIAKINPSLDVLGIDIAQENIQLAKTYHALPNVRYECKTLKSVEGEFDCILFTDVFHHVRPAEYASLLEDAKRLLGPSGYVFIKDIERRRGQISAWMDRYISGCQELYMHNCEELVDIVSEHLKVESYEIRFRFPFPHYYVKAMPCKLG